MTTYSVAGVSVCKGKVKVRFCSDLVLRVKNLIKQGDTDIKLVDLPNKMTKIQACDYLLNTGEFEQYRNDIEEIRGKKTDKKSATVVRISTPVPEIDDEVEEIRQLAVA